jgi:hypothetical protein
MARAAWSSLVTGGGLAAGNWIILGLVLRPKKPASRRSSFPTQ